MTVSTNELSDILSITARRIQDLEKEGVLSKSERNKWDVKECVEKYIDYKISNATSTYGLTEARAQKEFADAELKKLILAERRGEVIPIEKLEKELGDIAVTLSNKLYSLPQRLKMSVNLSDETESALNIELANILKELKMPQTYTAGTTKKEKQ
jgi:hypothetical protein|nr:MAG TPA: Protein of unknown function (DUF1441) [Caudoviricetes sp.]